MRPQFPTNLLVCALRSKRAPSAGRYSFVAEDRQEEEYIPIDPKLHEEHIIIQGRSK